MTKEERREYYRLWRLKNRDKVNASQKAYRVKHPELVSKCNKRYHQKHKERLNMKAVENSRNRSAKEHARRPYAFGIIRKTRDYWEYLDDSVAPPNDWE